MSSLKKELGSLFPGKVQTLPSVGRTKSGSCCTGDGHQNTGHARTQDAPGAGQCHLGTAPSHGRASGTSESCGSFSLSCEAQWRPCPTSSWGTPLGPDRNSMERARVGGVDKREGSTGTSRLLPNKKEGNSQGVQEMSSPQSRKVRRVHLIWKYLLSHLETTSEPHRPPRSTGQGGTQVARVPLSWPKGHRRACEAPGAPTEDERLRRTPVPRKDRGHGR